MLAKWLRDAMDSAGISGTDLAREMSQRLGRSIDRAAIHKMRMLEPSDRVKPRKIAADEMFAISEITGFPLPDAETPHINEVPRVAMVRAGAFTDTVPISEFEELPTEKAIGLPPGDWIAFTVEGDSMDRVSPSGSVIFVNRKERQLLDNKLYVVVTEQGEATYKRYRSNPPRLEPVSSNPEHEAIFPDGRLKVVGRVRRSVYEIG